MPKSSGTSLEEKLKARSPNGKLNGHPSESIALQGLPEDTIPLQITGGGYNYGEVYINHFGKEVWVRGEKVSLDPREFELLSVLTASPNKVLSIDELLEEAWGSKDYSPVTVMQYIHCLRRKIERDPKHPKLIGTVVGHGYVYHAPGQKDGIESADYDDGVVAINFEQRRVWVRHREVYLTTKEFELFSVLTASPEEELSIDELVEAAWGSKNYSSRTVTTYISRLRGKIERDPKHPKLIGTVVGHGYVYHAPGQKDGIESADYDDGVVAINFEQRRVWVRHREVYLTTKEFELLSVLNIKANLMVSREELGKAVWGSEDYNPGTVMGYISRLRGKIERDPKHPELIVTSKGLGKYEYIPPNKHA